MVDETIILATERLRDDVEDLRKNIRQSCPTLSRQVTAEIIRGAAARVAERWLVEVASHPGVADAIGSAVVANLSVNFQRLLTFSEHATIRRRYEGEIRAILKDYSVRVVMPLKMARGRTPRQTPDRTTLSLTAFVGQSFDDADETVNTCVAEVLKAMGIQVTTGERPRAESISTKVKHLIDEQSIFVGIFTRRDKIAGKQEWITSPWVIDEKAYAVGRQKPLILLKEYGVGSIGGIQGDYEFIEFSRVSLEKLAVSLIQLFQLANEGLRE